MMNLRFLSTAKIISSTRKCHVLQYVCVCGGGGCHVLRGEYRVPSGVTLPTPATAPAVASVPSYLLWSRCCVCHYNIYLPCHPSTHAPPPGEGGGGLCDRGTTVGWSCRSLPLPLPPPPPISPRTKLAVDHNVISPIITARVWVRGTDQWGGGG